MKFGFFMMPLHLPSENPVLSFDRDLEMIQYAEDLDYDEFYVGEHHTASWEPIPCPEMFLAKASGLTKNIKLGTAVVSAPIHHPFLLAERFAFLDQLSRGRAIMGLGPCGLPPDVKLFNIPPSELRERLHESIEIMVQLLESENPVSYTGKYWDIKEMSIQLKSYQKPRLKMALATSGSQRSLELAGRYGAILFSPMAAQGKGTLPLKDHFSHAKKIADENNQSFEKEDWRLVTYIYLSETKEQAWREVTENIQRDMKEYFWVINGGTLPEWAKNKSDSEITSELIAEKSRWIIGTPDDAIEELEKINTEVGGMGGLMLTTHEWVSPEKQKKSMELFARYVIPHFRGHTKDLVNEWEHTKKMSSTGELPRLLGSNLSSNYPLGGNRTNINPLK